MLLSEQDPNGGGRMSRASNVSALSRTSGKPASRAPSSEIQPALDRGVSSMLRTGTEMGNVGIGTQFDDLSGINNMQRPMRSRATSRMSTASSMSNTSSRASKQLRHFPSSSSAPRQPMSHYGQQYVTDTLSPTTMNASGSSPFNGRAKSDRDSHRSHSMTHTIQLPRFGLVSNRSLTSLRPQPASRSSNSYNYPISYGSGLRPPGPYQRSVSPALGDDARLPPQGLQAYDDQRVSYAVQPQSHGNPVRAYYNHPQQHAGQRQEYRGYSSRHNPGQIRAANPSSRSTMSLEDRAAVEDEEFPVYGESYHRDQPRQMQNLNSGHLMPRKALGNVIREARLEDRRDHRPRGGEPRSEAPPLPVDHKSRIAVEQARLKRSAPASMSSFNTNLRTDSDPPSSDMALPPTPKDGISIEVHRSLDRTKVFKVADTNRLVVTEEHSAVPHYGMDEQLERNEAGEPGAEAIPISFTDRTKIVVEQSSPGEATLKSDPFLGQEARPMSMEVVSPQSSNIGHIAFDPKRTGGFNDGRYPVFHKVNELFGGISIARGEALVAVKKVIDSKVSVPEVPDSKFSDDVKDENTVSPGHSTEDGMSDVLAGYQGNDSKNGTGALVRVGTIKKDMSDTEEHTDVSTDHDLKPLPLALRSRNSHVQKSSDELSFKSCTDQAEASLESASFQMGKDPGKGYSASAIDVVSQQDRSCKEADACSVEISASPVRASSVPPSRLPSSNLGTLVMSQNRATTEVPRSKPLSAMLRKQPPVPRRESSFSIVANRLRTNSKQNMKQGSVSVSGSSSTLSTTHMTPVVPPQWHRYAPSATGGGAQQLLPSSGIATHSNSSALTPLANIQEDTTTNLRLSGYRYPGPSHYLPDLKEESHEDSSLNTSASNLKGSSFRFPFGIPSGVRASGEDPISFSRRSSMVSHRQSVIGSNVGSALGQAHGLPSMRFSRMNLFDGLTDELGLRYSRSMEEVPNASQRMSRGSPLRPASAGDVTGMRLSLAELNEAERSRLSMQPTAMMSLFAMHRARSPELMAEIERLTIPSVGGLTQRFSEFFPSLREYYQCGEPSEFPIEEGIEKHALEEIHEIHPTQKRSSARLRPMRGVSHMVVIEDDLYNEITSKEKGSGSPGRPNDGGAANSASVADSIADESAYEDDVTATPTHNKTAPLPKLQVPSPAVLRPRSHTVGPQELRISGDSALSSRRSLRSIVSTPTATETRPWNSDKNYPWATSTNPAIEISLPRPTVAKHSPRPGPSHLRNRVSDVSTASSFSTAQTATASPFGSPSDSTAHARHHRFSAFGRNGDQPHAVGERYPTSALSPPTAIFRDHLSASDTSDDEHYDTTHKTRLSLRKRFSSTRKAKLDNQTAIRASRSKTNAQDLASSESTKPSTNSILQDCVGEAQAFTSSTTANRHTFRNAEGMRAVDYRKHRIIDRIKTWLTFDSATINPQAILHYGYYNYLTAMNMYTQFTVFITPGGLIWVIPHYQQLPLYPPDTPPSSPPPPPNTPEPGADVEDLILYAPAVGPDEPYRYYWHHV
ncbi:unnamed protein product [Alternaria alternata]